MDSICRDTKPKKQMKNAFRNRVGMWVATRPPRKVPSRMPGVMLRKMSQWTAPRLWWARLLEMDVTMMLASEVPRASCCTYSAGTP